MFTHMQVCVDKICKVPFAALLKPHHLCNTFYQTKLLKYILKKLF